MKGLQDFISASSSRLSIFRDRLVGVLPASVRNATTWESSSNSEVSFKGKQLKSSFPQECFAQLLLLLLHHRGPSIAFNPFRQAFSYLADLDLDGSISTEEQQDIEMLNMRSAPTALSVSYVHVNLRLIVQVITEYVP